MAKRILKNLKVNEEICGMIVAVGAFRHRGVTHSGYRLFGDNVMEVLASEGAEFFDDGTDIGATLSRSDITKEYTFRFVPKGKNVKPLLDALYNDCANRELVEQYTEPIAPYLVADDSATA